MRAQALGRRREADRAVASPSRAFSDVFLAGDFQGTLDFDDVGGPLNAGAATDAFIVKLEPGPRLRFGTGKTPLRSPSKRRRRTRNASNLVVVGTYLAGADLGCGPLDAGSNVFLAKLDAAGGTCQAAYMRTFTVDQPNVRVAVSSANEIYLVGSFDGMAVLGGDVLDSGGVQDVRPEDGFERRLHLATPARRADAGHRDERRDRRLWRPRLRRRFLGHRGFRRRQ